MSVAVVGTWAQEDVQCSVVGRHPGWDMGMRVDGGHEAWVTRQRFLSLGQWWAKLLQGGLCSGRTGRIQNFSSELLLDNGPEESTVVLWSVASEWMGGETVGLGAPGWDIIG